MKDDLFRKPLLETFSLDVLRNKTRYHSQCKCSNKLIDIANNQIIAILLAVCSCSCSRTHVRIRIELEIELMNSVERLRRRDYAPSRRKLADPQLVQDRALFFCSQGPTRA